jgi:rhamnosyltransferase subunit B
MDPPAPTTGATRARRRIVLTTLGSLGDLHPYLALAAGLQQRGHEAIVATSESYRAKVEALGIGFRPVRPDVAFIEADPERMRRLMDMRKGTERIICGIIMPALRDSYADTLAAAEGADLLIGHPIAYTTRLVAETRRLPWASVKLSPIGFMSCHDPGFLDGNRDEESPPSCAQERAGAGADLPPALA